MSDKVELLKKIELYRASHPDLKRLTDEQIISIMVEEKVITLSEAEKISVFGVQSGSREGEVNFGNTKTRTITLPSGRKIVIKDGITKYYAADGVELKKEYFEKQEGQVDVRPSGRYSVTKAGKTGYYAADGTELNAKYFKQVEGNDTKVTLSDGKTYNLNETLTSRINNVASDLKKAEDNNGFIGKGWSWFKNTTGIGDSSDKVREAQEAEKKLLAQFNSNEQKRPEIFKELTGVDYTPENLEKFIKGEIKLKSEQALSGYKEGQEMASDVAGDIVSGIAAVGIYTASVAAAPFTGGASIAVGVAAATASGALIKAGVKAADTIGTDREYTFDDFKHDAVTGGFSGAIAPVTGGMGGAAGKTVATRLGIQAIKQTGKAAAAQGSKSGLKTALLNPTGYEYIGGNALKRGAALGAEMATDGAVGGAVDNAFRTAYDGGGVNEVLNAAGEGFVGGAIMSPIIGGGMKAAGKLGHSLGEKQQGVRAGNQSKNQVYVRPKKLSLEILQEKINNSPELKSNPICKHLLYTLSRDDFSKQQKKMYLAFLDMVISNDALIKNKSLQDEAQHRTLFINNKETLNFLEEYINNPDLNQNKYISGALKDFITGFNSSNPQYVKFIENILQHFKDGDMTIIKEILDQNVHLKNYYYHLATPERFIGKDFEDLSAEEIAILKEWILKTTDRPPESNFLSGVFPALPATREDFPVIVKKLQQKDWIDTTKLTNDDIKHFKENLLGLTISDDTKNAVQSLMPEIFQGGKAISDKSLKHLRIISATDGFKNLEEKDKYIVALAAIIQDSDEDLYRLTKKIVNIAQRFGFSKYDAEKIANIVTFSNLIEDFMSTTKDSVKYHLNGNREIVTNRRKEFFDNAAFLLKEGNTFELAKILYSTKDKPGLTRHLDKMLSDKIHEIKSHDFMLPQTPKSSYHNKAKNITVNNGGKTYNVRVIKRSEIDNFCGYLHTPENVSGIKEASILQNMSKFYLASKDNLSERVICACYVDKTSKSFVNNYHYKAKGNGFIISVSNNKQFVGAGGDISSVEKTRKQMIQSYYNKNDLTTTSDAHVPEGTEMTKLRTLVSDNLKRILKIDDDEYITRMDKIKEELGDEILSFERLSEIDPQMADAYKELFSARIGENSDFEHAILRDDYVWNEFLISEPQISDIYTTHLNLLPEEYLEIAANPENDIVIVLMYE